MAYDPEATVARYDHLTAKEYLDRLGFPPKARQMLFDVFAHSFFNPEEDFSAAELILMMHFYFLGNREDRLRRRRRPLLRQDLRAAERLPRRARRLGPPRPRRRADQRRVGRPPHPHPRGRREAPRRRGRARRHGTCPSGHPGALTGLGDAAWRATLRRQSVTLPFAVWRLWLDRPVAAERTAFIGTTGLGMLDNISLYHLFEDESRAWADAHGGAVVELHAYAVPEAADEAAIKADLLAQLHAVYPETRGAAIVEERFLLRRDCPAFRPGEGEIAPSDHTRPGALPRR